VVAHNLRPGLPEDIANKKYCMSSKFDTTIAEEGAVMIEEALGDGSYCEYALKQKS